MDERHPDHMSQQKTARRWQFSLYGLFIVMTAAAIYFAIVARSPWLATAAVCWVLGLYTVDLLIAVGRRPAGARAIVLATVIGRTLAGTLLVGIAAFLTWATYGSGVPPLDTTTWLIIVAPLVIGGLACYVAAWIASRRARDESSRNPSN